MCHPALVHEKDVFAGGKTEGCLTDLIVWSLYPQEIASFAIPKTPLGIVFLSDPEHLPAHLLIPYIVQRWQNQPLGQDAPSGHHGSDGSIWFCLLHCSQHPRGGSQVTLCPRPHSPPSAVLPRPHQPQTSSKQHLLLARYLLLGFPQCWFKRVSIFSRLEALSFQAVCCLDSPQADAHPLSINAIQSSFRIACNSG